MRFLSNYASCPACYKAIAHYYLPAEWGTFTPCTESHIGCAAIRKCKQCFLYQAFTSGHDLSSQKKLNVDKRRRMEEKTDH